MAKPFKTDNMTVDEILNLGDDMIRHMDKRDLSRALRTVALAANKRLLRMERHAEKTFDEDGNVRYREKGNLGMDFNALYQHTDEQGNVKKFGVGRKKKDISRADIKAEFERVRGFMNAPSSTIPGSIQLRMKKEKAVFGQIREELTREMDEAERERTIAQMDDLMTEVYRGLHEWKEDSNNLSTYTKKQGKEVIRMLKRRMQPKYDKTSGRKLKEAMTRDEAVQDVNKHYERKYQREKKREQDERAKEIFAPPERFMKPFEDLLDSGNEDDLF